MTTKGTAGAATAGPWCTLVEESDRPYIRVRGTVIGARYKIANVLLPDYAGAHQSEIEEARANARLIAAARCLHEALRLTLIELNACASQLRALGYPGSEGGSVQRAQEAARAALASAGQ